MTWLDFWPLPWMLYDALSLQVLAAASFAAVALAGLAAWIDLRQTSRRRVG